MKASNTKMQGSMCRAILINQQTKHKINSYLSIETGTGKIL